MRILRRCAVSGVGAVTILATSLVVGPSPAGAECTETNGITMCQDVLRNVNPAEQELWYPYPCEDDFLCDDGVSVVFDYGNDNNPPDNANRPNNDLPRPDRGRPGRPGGGGGGIGGGR